jgi:hypothetical protein
MSTIKIKWLTFGGNICSAWRMTKALAKDITNIRSWLAFVQELF